MKPRWRAISVVAAVFVNAIFSKLGLSEEKQLHPRVKAALIFLAEAPTAGTSPGGQHH